MSACFEIARALLEYLPEAEKEEAQKRIVELEKKKKASEKEMRILQKQIDREHYEKVTEFRVQGAGARHLPHSLFGLVLHCFVPL